MPAMVGKNQIARLQGGGHRYPGPFLPNAGVNGAKQFSLGEQIQQSFFNRPDEKRLLEQLERWRQSLRKSRGDFGVDVGQFES
jgi:hypothetical protein